MPLTFPSHAAAVLPIKLAWPARWDGVALVLGSAVPDLPYAVQPYVQFDAHRWAPVLWFCVPIALFGTWIVRRAAPAIAAHLPNLGGFALRDYRVLGGVKHRWYVTLGSAFVGVFTHVFWDSFTHPRSTRIWSFLPLGRIAFHGEPWWHVLQLASTAIGALVTAILARHIGRRHLLIAWHGEPPTVPTRYARFWLATTAVAIVGLATLPALTESRLTFVLGVRLLIIGAVALLSGSVAVR